MRIVTVLAALLLFLTACQNDPDPTGIGLIPDTDIIGALDFDSQRDSSASRSAVYPFEMTHGTADIISVGEAEGYTSRALMRWIYFPAGYAAGGRIVSATIRLHSLPYHLGDASAPFRLEAREITSFWNSYTFTNTDWADLKYEATPAGIFEGTFGDNDSIDIPIDSALVRTWLINSSVDSNITKNYGVMLQAPTGGVRSFYSLDASSLVRPQLTVIIELDGVLDTLAGESADDTYLVTGAMREDAQRIVLQGGTSVRGKLYFDLSAIPPASIVNFAQLYLTKDPDLSTANYRGADTVLVYESVDSTDNVLNSSGVFSREVESSPGVYIADGILITRAVQKWVNHKDNYGFILVAMNENTDLDRLALYGADAPEDKRPRLVVTYTTKP